MAPLEAFHANEIDVLVVPVTVRPPGVGGVVVQPVVVAVTAAEGADSPTEL